jgi:DNA-binding transcriptional LysR family regulator
MKNLSISHLRLPRVSLEQWIVFQAIIETGSFSKAADTLFKSQSTISYNINKMQEIIGVNLFNIIGRKAQLTQAGQLVLKRSRKIVAELSQLEDAIRHFQQGIEKELPLIVDELFPIELLSIALNQFETLYPNTHVMVTNSRKNLELMDFKNANAHCAITRNAIRGDSTKLLTLDCYPYAHPDYRVNHRRLISHEALPLPAEIEENPHCCIWQVDSLSMMMELIASNQGYGWLPDLHVERSHLPLRRTDNNPSLAVHQPLFITAIDPSLIGKALADLLKIIKRLCQVNYDET